MNEKIRYILAVSAITVFAFTVIVGFAWEQKPYDTSEHYIEIANLTTAESSSDSEPPMSYGSEEYEKFLRKKSTLMDIETTEQSTEVPFMILDLEETVPETETETEVTMEEPTEAEPYYPVYSVNGSVLNEELQRYVYTLFQQFGVEEDKFPLWLAQIYQESRYNHRDISYGKFYGYCQLSVDYWDEWVRESGCWTSDLYNDPYANLYVGTWLMLGKYKQYGDWNTAIKMYYNSGIEESNQKYLNDVSQWFPTVQQIK